jgi:hypothetical protein
MKTFLISFLAICCLSCGPQTLKTNLSEAGVKRITERYQVMIGLYGYAETKQITTCDVIGCIQNRDVYDENGKAFISYSGGSEGLIEHTREPNSCGYVTFSEHHYKYGCIIDKDRNIIVETAKARPRKMEYKDPYCVTDTIRDFVIIPESKIILSKADYDLLRKTRRLFGNKDSAKRYVFYKYE